MNYLSKPKIGLALGSGSARGMAHIGIIQGLHQLGIKPDIVCGTSVGALIGGAYVCGHLDNFTHWATHLKPADIIHYMNIRITGGSGLAKATRLIDYFREHYGDQPIEQLSVPFAAVATRLKSGQEVWLKEGCLWNAVRASIALPGLLSPALVDNDWLVDGGLVNPVPVSLCRAMGADIIIAVNLNGDIIGRHFDPGEAQNPIRSEVTSPPPAGFTSQTDATSIAVEEDTFFEKLSNNLWEKTAPMINEWFSSHGDEPNLANVIASSINIMQDRITRSRLAGEPADILLSPHLSHIGLMEFNRAEEAITEGRHCIERHLPQINFIINRLV